MEVREFFPWEILAYSGLMENKEVTWMPAYGPEQRGGTANVTVIVSDERISSPILSKYDTAIILNQPSLAKFENKVKPGGVLIYDGYGIINPPTARTFMYIALMPWTKPTNGRWPRPST